MGNSLIKIINAESLKGKFIVSHPNMSDNRFIKTVIFILEHNEHGAEGVVINKLSAYNFISLVNSISNIKIDLSHTQEKIKNAKILRGGPLNNDKIFILHSNDYKNQSTTKINNNILYTKNLEILEDIINNSGPLNFSIFIGNCIWTAMQLDIEIKNDSWIVFDSYNEYILSHNYDKLWDNIYQSLGITNTNSSYFYNSEKTIQ